MDNEKRIELFHLLRIKLDEIENILEHYGGKDNYLSTYCFWVYTPEDDENDEKYELMMGMHIAEEYEHTLMMEAIDECYHSNLDDPEDGDSGKINYWLNK